MPASVDVLRGAGAIAAFMSTTPKRVYALKAQQAFPFFMEGATICARKTTLMAWVEMQEMDHDARGTL